MKFNIFFYFPLALIFASCSILSSDSTHSNIVGQWEWVKSTGGFIGHTVTPDSTGYSTKQIHFSANNEFLLFRSDTLVEFGRYHLEKGKYETVIKYEIESGSFYPNQKVEFNNRDILLLIDECVDCYTNTFIREK